MKEPLRNRFRHRIAQLSSGIEIAISLLVLVAICVAGVRVAGELLNIATAETPTQGFSDFLADAFNLIIGVEFIKMLAKHTPGSALEVLLVAIARQMLVSHSTALENLLGILAILLIFVIRKYFFVPSFGSHLPGQDALSPDLFEPQEWNKPQ